MLILTVLLGVLTALFVIIYTAFTSRYKYWKRRNVPYITPRIPWGSMDNPLTRKENIGVALVKLYKEIKGRGLKYAGIFTFHRPILLLADLDMVKSVLIKDFDYFTDRLPVDTDSDKDPLMENLFQVQGLKWRHLRTKLTPTFTTGKIKFMFDTLVACTPPMVEAVREQGSQPIDIHDVFERFTCDVIGSCAFGLECNSFKDPNSPFRLNSAKILRRTPLFILRQFFPKVFRALGVRRTPEGVTDFFMKMVGDAGKYRRENKVKRNDFLQLLLDLGDEITFDELAAQAFIFFVAGFETTAASMTFALYLLAKNPDIQDRLRTEVKKKLEEVDGKLSYDAINEMKYLSMVVDEALRMYPPAAVLLRRVVKEYTIPGDNVVLEKQTLVFTPTYAIHYDPEYYPEPEVFDPERFSDENKNSRSPYAYLPFGEGPRNCIGLRFGLMQVKVGLVSLIKNFKFSVNSKTQEPLRMHAASLVLAASGGVWLNAEKV